MLGWKKKGKTKHGPDPTIEVWGMNPQYVVEHSLPEPPPPPDPLVKMTDKSVGDDVGLNPKPELVTVEDYKKLRTGKAHILSEKEDGVMKYAYCGHKEEWDWNVSEILEEWQFRSIDGPYDVCAACRERVDLKDFGDSDL